MKYLLGMDDYFNYYKFDYIDNPEDKYEGYFNFKESSFDNDKISSFNNMNYKINKGTYKNTLLLFFIESYKGISLQINSKDIYDQYILYEVKDDKEDFICMSKDILILSDKIQEGHTYYVEAYKKYDNYYLLSNVSDKTECIFKEINNKNYDLTICIPVYNGKIFLPRTLDSVILSSYNNLKILIINDGSKDGTNNVLKWYSNKYDFIRIINNDNHGVSYTRNMLLDYVDTEYMAFLDADDIVSPNMYKLLMDGIKTKNADVSICRSLVRNDFDNDEYVLNVKCDKYKTYTYDDMIKEKDNNTYDNIYFVALWNKVVKTSIAKLVRFPDSKYYEDSAYTPTLYSYVDKFVFVSNATYIWDKRKRITKGTYSNEYDKRDINEMVSCFFDAHVYPIDNCFNDRLDYIEYSSFKELLDYFDLIKNNKDGLCISYKNRLIELSKRINIHNKYFDKDLLFKLSCFKNM